MEISIQTLASIVAILIIVLIFIKLWKSSDTNDHETFF